MIKTWNKFFKSNITPSHELINALCAYGKETKAWERYIADTDRMGVYKQWLRERHGLYNYSYMTFFDEHKLIADYTKFVLFKTDFTSKIPFKKVFPKGLKN